MTSRLGSVISRSNRAALLLLVVGCIPACSSAREADLDPFSPPPSQVLVLGEVHGTQEAPKWFEKEVRRLIEKGRPLNVGLELTDADILSACSALSDHSADGRWFDETQDGRTSQAMADLACALGKIKDEGNIRLFGLVDDSQPSIPRAQRYADAIRNSLLSPNSVTIVLAGNLHARHVPTSMTGVLEAAGITVHTATIAAPAAEAWTCSQDGACGAAPIDSRFCPAEIADPRGPLFVADVSGRWNYCLIFPSLTPSPPIKGVKPVN